MIWHPPLSPFPGITLLLMATLAIGAEGPGRDGSDGLLPFAGPAKAKEMQVLGRVSAHSVTVSVRTETPREVFVEWGTTPGTYSGKTAAVKTTGAEPVNLRVDGLPSDSAIFYRVQERVGTAFTARKEYRFQTARSPGKPFTFLIEADPHLDENSEAEIFSNTLSHMENERADFLLDLGDTFMCEKLIPQNEERVLARHALMRDWFETITPSLPLFLVLGNHEGEFGWQDKKANALLPQWAMDARITWFANPVPDDFFTGNGTPAANGRLPQNYYAFTWGDALIVVLDIYRHTPKKPSRRDTDMWAATIGEEQYRWMRRTLEESRAPFKFVFSHQVAGGTQEGGRGGVEVAHLFEWGGMNRDGSRGFDEKRPGWGKPIHQVFMDTKVTAYFHGHDHLYARQMLDGIVYQECPQPSARNTMEPNHAEEYGYKGGTILGNSGYLKVSIAPGKATVIYERITVRQTRGGGRRESKGEKKVEGIHTTSNDETNYEWKSADSYALIPRE